MPSRRDITDRWRESAERRLVVLAVRAALDPRRLPALREALGSPLDWSRVLSVAWAEKVLPLVHLALGPVAERVPPEELEALGRRAGQIARTNLHLAAELVRLVERLGGAGVRVLPVKGPLLARRLFGDVGLRHFADLDLLVPGESLDAALAVARSCGYRVLLPAVPLTPARLAAQVRFDIGQHLVLERAEDRARLEIHWTLLPAELGFRVAGERFWESLETLELAGREVRDLPDELLFRYLCLHGVRDQFERLSIVADVAAALDRFPRLDWRRMVAEAGRDGTLRALLLGPYLAHRHLAAALPEPLERAVTRESGALAAAAGWCGPFHDRSPWRRLRYRTRLRRGPLAKLGQLARELLQPRMGTLEAIRLPPRAFVLYYAIRPLQIAAKGLRRLWWRVRAAPS